MRWNSPEPFEKRVVRRFLFFPKSLNGETRWWEFAFIRQNYVTPRALGHLFNSHWEDLGWVDE